MAASPEPTMIKICIDHDYLGSTTVACFTETMIKMGWAQKVTVVERDRDGKKEAMLCICFGDHVPYTLVNGKEITRAQVYVSVRQLVYLMFPSETENESELQQRSLLVTEFIEELNKKAV
jgi:predicted transcriptional regulator YheO